MENFELTDRYKALGIPYPDPETMCKGQCDGVGLYPQSLSDPMITEAERERWREAHDKPGAHDGECDGWHFIVCADCNGTGKRTQ